MSLSLHLPDLVYDCVCCGKGCKADWNITVNPTASRAIKKSDIYIPFDRMPDGRLTLAKTEEGQCVYLDESNLCKIHKELGFESKPQGCAQFPAAFVPTPDGLFVGLSFFCTSIQEGTGRPLEAHREWLQKAAESAVKRFKYKGHSGEIHLAGERLISWEDYQKLEKDLRSQLKPYHLQLPFIEAPFRLLGQEPTPELMEKVYPALGAIFAGAVGIVEAPHDPDKRLEIYEKMLAGQPFHSPRFDREITPVLAIPLFEELAHRFLDHVLFRKFLIQGDLLGRLPFMLVVKKVLDYETQLHAQIRGGEPEEQDFHRALELVEKHFLFHSDGQEVLFDKLSPAYLEAVPSE